VRARGIRWQAERAVRTVAAELGSGGVACGAAAGSGVQGACGPRSGKEGGKEGRRGKWRERRGGIRADAM